MSRRCTFYGHVLFYPYLSNWIYTRTLDTKVSRNIYNVVSLMYHWHCVLIHAIGYREFFIDLCNVSHRTASLDCQFPMSIPSHLLHGLATLFSFLWWVVRHLLQNCLRSLQIECKSMKKHSETPCFHKIGSLSEVRVSQALDEESSSPLIVRYFGYYPETSEICPEHMRNGSVFEYLQANPSLCG